MHQYSSFPTTAGMKYVSIDFKPNKVYKQLKSAIDQTTGQEHFDIDVTTEHPQVAFNEQGSWSADNLHPMANYWLLISCDQPGTIGSAVSGSEVKIRIKRENFWRDKIA